MEFALAADDGKCLGCDARDEISSVADDADGMSLELYSAANKELLWVPVYHGEGTGSEFVLPCSPCGHYHRVAKTESCSVKKRNTTSSLISCWLPARIRRPNVSRPVAMFRDRIGRVDPIGWSSIFCTNLCFVHMSRVQQISCHQWFSKNLISLIYQRGSGTNCYRQWLPFRMMMWAQVPTNHHQQKKAVSSWQIHTDFIHR